MTQNRAEETADLQLLANNIATGCSDSESALITRFNRGLRFFLQYKMSIAPPLLDDIVQETFLVVIEKLRAGKVEKPQSLGAFIRQTGKNIALAGFRKRDNRGDVVHTEIVERATSENAGPLQSADKEELSFLMREFLKQLNQERDRVLLSRFYLDEADKKEICAELSLSAAHFDRVLYRAKMRLRTLLLTHRSSLQ